VSGKVEEIMVGTGIERGHTPTHLTLKTPDACDDVLHLCCTISVDNVKTHTSLSLKRKEPRVGSIHRARMIPNLLACTDDEQPEKEVIDVIYDKRRAIGGRTAGDSAKSKSGVAFIKLWFILHESDLTRSDLCPVCSGLHLSCDHSQCTVEPRTLTGLVDTR
jgi:hypothetical protein